MIIMQKITINATYKANKSTGGNLFWVNFICVDDIIVLYYK